MSYEIEEQERYFLLTFTGSVDKQSILSAYASLLQSKRFKQQTHTIWDLRNATAELSFIDIKELASSITASSEKRSNCSRSAYITVDPTDRATLQHYITATAHYPVEFKIFTGFSAARQWILS